MRSIWSSHHCDRCNIELSLGSTKYNVRIEITSDWDGYLPDVDLDDRARDRLLQQMAALDEKTLEDQVHMELTLTLCPACRTRFLEELELASDGKPLRKSKPPMSLQ
jgi:hypothetical protein